MEVWLGATALPQRVPRKARVFAKPARRLRGALIGFDQRVLVLRSKSRSVVMKVGQVARITS